MNDFDDIVRQIRDEKVDDAVVDSAAARVHGKLFAHGPALAVNQIRNCADFQALIPEYLAGHLNPARRLLLEDHTHECVRCRRAVAEAKAPAGKVVRMDSRRGVWVRPELRWAIAALLVIGLGVGAITVLPNLIPASGARATVASVDGALYKLTMHGVVPVAAGDTISEGEPVRAAKATYAVLKLGDGSTVEMNDRAELSVSITWGGTTVRLNRGNIIIQAAKQKRGRHLYVAAGDANVAVKGTVFAVSRGLKGSRVSVVEGVVEVSTAGHNQTLYRGDQATTDPNLLKTSVSDEVAWSRNAAHYYALLGEFATLQKKLDAIPGPGLRYNSSLAGLLPPNTTIFVSVPNIGSTLAEAERLIEEQARESAVLREWWEKRGSGLGKTLNELKGLGDYVGDEIVVGLSGDMNSGPNSPTVVAKVRRPGLKAYLETHLAEMGADHHPAIAGNRAELAALRPSAKEPAVYAGDDMFVMATDPVAMNRALSGQGGFLQTALGQRVAQAYQGGAGWLIAADLEQMVKKFVSGKQEPDRSGFTDASYLIIERKDLGGKAENRATVTFAQERRGVASWLGTPGPLGSLEFVSPEATAVTSFVIKNPQKIIEEFLAIAQQSGHSNDLAELEAKTGVNVNDVAAALGSEITVAVDGPVLPMPSWKVIAEVVNGPLLQSSIEKFVAAFNANAPEKAGKLTLTTEQSGGRTYYTLKSSTQPLEAHYTYVDNYLLAGSSVALLEQAMQNRRTGFTLTHSQMFRSLLPRDGYTNFSGVMFMNTGSTVAPILDKIKGAATESEKKSINAFIANSTPTLIYAYGEPDRITLASTGSFFGMNIGTLLGAPGAGNASLFPQIFGQVLGGGKMRPLQRQ